MTLRLAVVAGLLAAAARLAAAVEPVVESLGPGAFVFHADAAARAAALPSYVLAAPPAPRPVAGAGPTVRPVFSTDGGRHGFRIDTPPGTSFYGTGEVGGPLLRNGRISVTWNTDAYGYSMEAPSLYQSHPWVLAVRPDGSSFGVWADSTYRCEVDTGAAVATEIRTACEGPRFPAVVIEGRGPEDVLRGLARLTGTMPMPPRWALGWHQCRWSYYPDEKVREVARGFRERQIPADVLWMDIDYMDSFRIFSFDPKGFPKPAALDRELEASGFHTVWMIDPGVKVEDGPGVTSIFDSGTAADVWVKDAAGRPFEGRVWPGMCRFPDFTAPRVRSWWSGWYRGFAAAGVDGVWNDMNEPAVFEAQGKTMPADNRHAGDPALRDWTGAPQGGRAAGPHARYHNVYGMEMARGTRDGMLASRPDRRAFVLTRAGHLGSHRYAATWTGDNVASWEHLAASIPMALNLGLSGQPFAGPDTGGFAGNGDAAMFARWVGIGALLPFARGHTQKGNVDKEPWSFGPAVEATARRAIERRYRLLPYFYTLFREAHLTGLPVARPVFFADPADPGLRAVEHAFLLGRDLLVVARVTPDGPVANPLASRGWLPLDLGDAADPDLPQLFVRPGAIVPLGPVMQHSGERPLDPLTLAVALDARGRAAGTLYEDAGDGFGFEKGEYLLTTYEAVRKGKRVAVRVAGTQGRSARPRRVLVVRPVAGGGAEARGRDGAALKVRLPVGSP